ncbi:MAG: hypothetical protein LKE40_03050 [Spirochaetia bacterium]|nr:hypothetical protein [Spirochaetia bacterium]
MLLRIKVPIVSALLVLVMSSVFATGLTQSDLHSSLTVKDEKGVDISALSEERGTSENLQKLTNISDNQIYEAITALYLSQSKPLPSSAAPYSYAELKAMLKRLDRSKMNAHELALYDKLVNLINGAVPKGKGKGVSYDFSGDIAAEGYYNSNTDQFSGSMYWQRPYREREKPFKLSLETWAGNNFYGYSEFTLGNTENLGDLPGDKFASVTYSTNIPLLAPAVMDDIDFNIPYRAFLTAGGSNWNLELGRDSMRWGNGESGSLDWGATMPFENLLKFSWFDGRSKLVIVNSYYTDPNAYISDDESVSADDDVPYEGDSQSDEIRGVLVHGGVRLETQLGKLGIAFAPTFMYLSSGGTDVIEGIYDSYTSDDGKFNPMLTLSMDYTVKPRWTIYFEGALDSLTSDETMAYGLILGAKHIKALGGLKVLKLYAEAAYTNPYLYLASTTGESQSKGDVGIGFVAASRFFLISNDTIYDSKFLGYKWGNDAFVGKIGAQLLGLDSWKLNASMMYMLHGTYDAYTCYTADASQVFLTSSHSAASQLTDGEATDRGYSAPSSRNAISQTLIASLGGECTLFKGLSVLTEADYLYCINFRNVSGVTASDLQLNVSVKLAF